MVPLHAIPKCQLQLLSFYLRKKESEHCVEAVSLSWAGCCLVILLGWTGEGLSVDTEWPSKAGMQDALLWGDLATSEATHSYTQWVG